MESTQYPAFRSHFPALDVSLEDFVRQRFADVREFNAEWAAREANLACGYAGDASQARPFSRSMSRPSLSERMSGLLHPSTSAQRTYSPALDSLPASARTDRASASFEQEFAAVSIGAVAAATAAGGGGGGVGSSAAARPAAAMPGAERDVAKYDGFDMSEPAEVAATMAATPLVQSLSLRRCSFSDASLAVIASTCPLLSKIDLSGAHGFSGDGFAHFVGALPHLSIVRLSDCGFLFQPVPGPSPASVLKAALQSRGLSAASRGGSGVPGLPSTTSLLRGDDGSGAGGLPRPASSNSMRKTLDRIPSASGMSTGGRPQLSGLSGLSGRSGARLIDDIEAAVRQRDATALRQSGTSRRPVSAFVPSGTSALRSTPRAALAVVAGAPAPLARPASAHPTGSVLRAADAWHGAAPPPARVASVEDEGVAPEAFHLGTRVAHSLGVAPRRLTEVVLSRCSQLTDAMLMALSGQTPGLALSDLNTSADEDDLLSEERSIDGGHGVGGGGTETVTDSRQQRMAEFRKRMGMGAAGGAPENPLTAGGTGAELSASAPGSSGTPAVTGSDVHAAAAGASTSQPVVAAPRRGGGLYQVLQCTVPMALRSISVSGCPLLTDTSLAFLAANCPELHSIDISYCDQPSITDAGIACLAQGAVRLQNVNLRGCSQLTNASVVALTKHCPALANLCLAGVLTIDDGAVSALATSKAAASSLLSLDVTRCRAVTASAIQNLLTRAPKLARGGAGNVLNITLTSVTDAELRMLSFAFSSVSFRCALTAESSTAESMLVPFFQAPPKEEQFAARKVFAKYGALPSAAGKKKKNKNMGDFMTTTEKGAPALTAEGAIIAQLMQGERGGALTTLSAQLVGPRKPGTSTTLVAGLSRDALIAAMDMVLGEGGGLGAAATQHNVADLVVLTFEAADILEGRGERTLFVWMFLRLLPLLPAGLVSQLLRQVPHYASWRTLAMLYETATADIPKTADAAHASLLQDVRRAIVHMWAAQLLRDEASMKKAAAGGAAAPASAGAGGACADAAKPAGKPKLSLASKWAPRMGGHFDRTCGLAAHLVEEVARQRALLAASAPRGEEAAAPAADDDAMDMDMDMDVDLPSAAATAPAALVAADVAPGMPAATFADGPVAAPKFDTLSPIARAKQRAYRIMLSALHAQLDVVEVKMAGKRWREIEPTSVPSRANKVYRAAFMNQMPKTKHARMNKEASKAGHRAGVLLTPGATLRSESVDRVECAEHFTAAAMASIANPEAAKVIKGGRNQAHELVTAYMGYKEEAADIMVEAMWANLVHGIESKGKFMPGLPLSDVSGSMAGIPMQVSIALGILMAKMQPKTSPWYGKLISFESNPQWCDIAACETLAASVNVVKSMPWGGSTNFGAALQLILQRAIAERVAQEDMPKILYVFTDMQFDQAQEGMGGSYGIRDATQMSDASEEPVPAHFRVAGTDIRAAFRDAGYTPPMIVFWNLRADGPPTFQAETSQPGVAMMSGFSQECLKQFFDEGELHSEEASGGAPAKVEKTPWQVLFEKLNSERYDRLRRVLMRVNAGLFTGYRWAKPAFRVEAEARAAAAAAAAAAEKEEAAVAAGAGASA